MAKPHVMASGIVESTAGVAGAVVAFVAVNLGVGGSRLFKLSGPPEAPILEELPAATTVDLGRFRRELERELGEVIGAIQAAGAEASIGKPEEAWLSAWLKEHLALRGVVLDP